MVEKVTKQNFYLSLLSLVCLILSLIVFYPLSMQVDRYSNLVLTIWAYSFYILQGISITLAIITFLKAVSLMKLKKEYLNLFSLAVNAVVFAIVGYELYWFLNHI